MHFLNERGLRLSVSTPVLTQHQSADGVQTCRRAGPTCWGNTIRLTHSNRTCSSYRAHHSRTRTYHGRLSPASPHRHCRPAPALHPAIADSTGPCTALPTPCSPSPGGRGVPQETTAGLDRTGKGTRPKQANDTAGSRPDHRISRRTRILATHHGQTHAGCASVHTASPGAVHSHRADRYRRFGRGKCDMHVDRVDRNTDARGFWCSPGLHSLRTAGCCTPQAPTAPAA